MRVTSPSLRQAYADAVEAFANRAGLLCHRSETDHAVALTLRYGDTFVRLAFDGLDLMPVGSLVFYTHEPMEFSSALSWSVHRFHGKRAECAVADIRGVLHELNEKFAAIKSGRAFGVGLTLDADSLLLNC